MDGARRLYWMQKRIGILSLDSGSPTHRAMRLRDGWGTEPLLDAEEVGILSLDSCSPTHRAMKLRDGWGTEPLLDAEEDWDPESGFWLSHPSRDETARWMGHGAFIGCRRGWDSEYGFLLSQQSRDGTAR